MFQPSFIVEFSSPFNFRSHRPSKFDILFHFSHFDGTLAIVVIWITVNFSNQYVCSQVSKWVWRGWGQCLFLEQGSAEAIQGVLSHILFLAQTSSHYCTIHTCFMFWTKWVWACRFHTKSIFRHDVITRSANQQPSWRHLTFNRTNQKPSSAL